MRIFIILPIVLLDTDLVSPRKSPMFTDFQARISYFFVSLQHVGSSLYNNSLISGPLLGIFDNNSFMSSLDSLFPHSSSLMSNSCILGNILGSVHPIISRSSLYPYRDISLGFLITTTLSAVFCSTIPITAAEICLAAAALVGLT